MELDSIDLTFVEQQFLCCTPLNRFKWNNSNNGDKIKLGTINPETQNEILAKTVNHDLIINYPIKKSYQRAFLKLLINELEKNCQEINDEIYSTYCSLVSTDGEESLTHYRHFIYDQNESRTTITLQESVNIVSLGTTGLCTWQAGLGLAEWCITNKELFDGKKILELGCGVGLTGLAVVRSCTPQEYVFSDIHSSVLNMLRENILINLKQNNEQVSNTDANQTDVKLKICYNGINVEAIRLSWEEVHDSLETVNCLAKPDIVLAADVLYDDSCFDSLAAALYQLLKNNGTCAIIAATVRNADTVTQFLKILGSYHLGFQDVERSEERFFIRTDDTPVRIMKIVNVKA